MPNPAIDSPTPPVSPEVQLLLCCARTQLDSAQAEQIKGLLRQELDWPDLIRTAQRHGLMPLLYHTLSRTYPHLVPPPVLNQLAARFQDNAGRNIALTKELLRLLKLLESHGIPAIPYKGPALAATVYGDISLRPFSDLDILVRKRDVLKAKALLQGEGYHPQPELNQRQEAVLLRVKNAYQLKRGDSKITLELHWDITPRYFSFQPDLDAIWKRLEPIPFMGTTVQALPAETLLLILCVHGTKHCWERLEWLCGVAELVRLHPTLNWQRLTTLARTYKSERHLLLGLLLAYQLLGTRLPEEIWARIQADATAGTLARQVINQFYDAPNHRPDIFKRVRFQLAATGHLLDRIRYCLDFAVSPNPRDWMVISLPSSLTFLYYPIRLLRLIGKYGVPNGADR